jgi:protein-disulfide isomerase
VLNPKAWWPAGSETYLGRIDLDFREGIRSGVNGTPTFFVNGVRHDGFFDFDTLLRALARRAMRT